MQLNIDSQKEAVNTAFKHDAKKIAIQAAGNNRPPVYNNYSSQQIGPIHYDLIGEAEKIYQWLIKDVI